MRQGEKPFSSTTYAKMSAREAAERLVSRGYRQVSRRFGHVARVDVSRGTMIEGFVRENFGHRHSGVPSLSVMDQEDHYRRCVTTDVITGVPDSVMSMIRDPLPSDEQYVYMMKETGLDERSS